MPATVADGVSWRLARAALDALVPAARAYVRHAPWRWGKDRLLETFFWRPRDFMTRTRSGALLTGNTTDIIQRTLYYFGVWEPHLTAWIAGRLKPGDAFVDVGANIGYFTLLAAPLVGRRGRVVAIEASPSIHALLAYHVALNDAANVRAVNAAALDRAGTVRVFRAGSKNIGETTVVPATAGMPLEAEVPAAPLTDLLAPEERRRARLIKIDVEGAELLAVRGLEPLLADRRPDLEVSVEIDPARVAGGRADDIVAIFARHGLYPYVVRNDYTLEGYLEGGAPAEPVRLTWPLETETDVIFSPVQAERLSL